MVKAHQKAGLRELAKVLGLVRTEVYLRECLCQTIFPEISVKAMANPGDSRSDGPRVYQKRRDTPRDREATGGRTGLLDSHWELARGYQTVRENL